nr:DUF4132 domain-containing protein [Nocardia crassostreae]
MKTIALDQLRRFERAMVRGRRWPLAQHRQLFTEHPLLGHPTRRLVWATFDEHGGVTGSFRIAEDRGFADASDDTVTLDDTGWSVSLTPCISPIPSARGRKPSPITRSCNRSRS